PLDLTGGRIDLGNAAELVDIGARTRDAEPRPVAGLAVLLCGHIEAGAVVGNIEGIPAWMVRHGPVTFGVERANDVPLPVLLENRVPIDVRLAGFHINTGNREIRSEETAAPLSRTLRAALAFRAG